MHTSAYLKSRNFVGNDKDIGEIRDSFKAYGIKVSYSPSEKQRRVIFSSTKPFRTSNEFDGFISECNGLILTSETWEPLVIPPRTFKSNVTVDVVNAHLARDEYEIIEAQDGTMVNLYYFDKYWRMSTTKGFDVTLLKWNNVLYDQAFKDCLRAKGVNIGEFYGSLDKTQCYTFCFTHPDFHPFWQNKTREELMQITFIQAVKVSNFAISRENPFDVMQISSQVIHKKTINIRDLFKLLPKTLNNYYNTGEACFGFILRFKDSIVITHDNSTHSHVFLESRLIQTIRKLFYSGQYSLITKEKGLDRPSFIIVNSFLDSNLNETFIKLFPQYKSHFARLEAISIKLIDIIINIHKTKSVALEIPDKLLHASEVLLNSLNKVFTLNFPTRDCVRIISTFILDPKFIEIFYELAVDTSLVF